jgi:hypothetical protein
MGNLFSRRNVTNCYIREIPFQNLQCTGTVVNNVCYGEPYIANGSNQCVPMKTVVVQPRYSQFVADETVVQAPYITTRGTSTTTTLEDDSGLAAITCTCKSTNPYSPTDSARTANCTRMECEAQYTGQLYLEVSGGNGASLTYYTDISIEPQTYTGGRNGTVYGTALVKPGTVLTVTFGYDAEPAGSYSTATGTQFPTAGGGGNGSLLGGSNGGGATVVSSGETMWLVGPGGGGAGRNGNGGDAGSSGPLLPFVKPTGSSSGSAGQVVIASVPPGGGGSKVGGTSSDPGGKGKSLQGGNATAQLASGGGGGSGFFGGGSGFTNSLPKPLAIHSAGGGGSSYSSLALSDIPYIRNRSLQPTSNYVVFGFPKVLE